MSTDIAKQLFDRGETLRSEEPVLWAVVRGRGGITRIALLLGWPVHRVEAELKAYVAVNTLKVSSGKVYNLEQTSPRYALLSRMKVLYLKIEEKVAGYDLANIDPNDIASSTHKVIRKARSEAIKEQSKNTLTEVQWKTLLSIWDNFEGDQFRTIELAKAQGRTSSGYTKGYLENIRRKGLLELINHDPRVGMTWRLTAHGVEMASSVDPSRASLS
jgi:hypothetical protein